MQRIDVLLEKLIAQRRADPNEPARALEVGEVHADRYTSKARFEAERAVFASTPSPVALDAELAARGASVAVDVAGVSVIVVRGDDGEVRAFRNACRHRATELVPRGAPCTKKAFVCPYHGWTYDLRGARIHVPHDASFAARIATDRIALTPAYAASRHGLVWAALEPFDLDAHLAPIEEDLAAMGIEHLALHRKSERDVVANWKVIVDAFLDGYHIRHLHRDSVYRFFVDALVEPERAGPHIRALTARRAIDEAPEKPADRNARELATPSYLIFPSTTVVLHPDFTSVLMCTPTAADRTTFTHAMLVPKGDAREAHWNKSFSLIDEGVFGSEDLAVVEAIQRGLATGANDSVLFGDLERASLWFHETLDHCLSAKNKSKPPVPAPEK